MTSDRAHSTHDTGPRRQRLIAGAIVAVGVGLRCIPSAAIAGELHDAVRAHDEAAVELLVASGIAVDESDFVLGTALHVAVAEGNAEIADLLIEHGAELEAVSEQEGSRALHLAAQFGDAAMVLLLLDRGADIGARDGYQRTPLFRAASGGNEDVVRLLLDRGADIEATEGKYGQTSLHEAAFQGHLDVVKLLLDRGANIHATDNTGLTPLRMAAVPQSYSKVGGAEMLEYMVVQGADPNAKDSSGMSILAHAKHHATAEGDTLFQEVVRALQRLGATE